MDVVIRTEGVSDAAGVRAVHEAAFDREDEAELVEAVRAARGETLSLVAARHGEIVGHVLFTPVRVGVQQAVGLGPLAVLPTVQGRGIGAALVREGLHHLFVAGHGAVVVLGSPEYYSRFGFRPAIELGVRWEHPAPEGAFQAIELRSGALSEGGIARYGPLFHA